MIKEHKENLKMLADYLLSGELNASFDMMSYVGGYDDDYYDYMMNCGTVGCAVGHGPYAGIPKSKDEQWVSYCERAFGINQFSYEFRWLFSSMWVNVDNSPEGAGMRILYFLKNGLPENFQDQMTGSSDLCYLD